MGARSVQMDQSADKKGLGDDLGWFPFPTVTGGAGAATDGVGGGNGIAVGKNAPPEALDFLKFFSSVENATKINDENFGLSPVVGTESAITDANLQAVLAGRGAGDVHAALPRPGDVARDGHGDQRGDHRPVRWRRRPRHRSARRSRTRPRPSSALPSRIDQRMTTIERAGPRRPARFATEVRTAMSAAEPCSRGPDRGCRRNG